MEIWEATRNIVTNPYGMTLLGISLVAFGYAWGKGWLSLESDRPKKGVDSL